MSFYDFRCVFLPYCIKKQDNGKYVVLNRSYRPVGFLTRKEINPSDFPVEVRFKGLTKDLAKRLSHNGSDDKNLIFLYEDTCRPTDSVDNMNSYLSKLKLLSKLGIKQDGF